MVSMECSYNVLLSPSRNLRGFHFSEESNLLGVVGGNAVQFISNPLEYQDDQKAMFPSQHGHPNIVRFTPGGSQNPAILLGNLFGPIDVYDNETLSLKRSYLEHSDKVTGIDWTSRDNHLFTTCSKDCTVRLYDLSLPHSLSTLQIDSNVCGVQTNPYNLNQIAFGTAQGKFFVYDLRKLSSPYLEVKGHSRTVTNIMFVSKDEVLSMSLDSTAKLWDIQQTVCTENYVGHIHHTYFVGVDCLDKYILMGGEDSTVRVYSKHEKNYIACEKISQDHCFVCGCTWLRGWSTRTKKYCLVLDNLGRLCSFVLSLDL